ncbi:type IX secretion system membrane protein PorP/SprF [Catalinimonas sp. 4WD22]|uniref:PorP/SprF family type IX secretion system membrane protein n=1 Tax=Catalinimonas locisalis TaxID=3133978 RepID=UPI0031012B7C
MQKTVTKLLVAVSFIFISVSNIYAQDPQFSQFYAAPLYMNPAFAGSTELSRVGLNFRSQWPSLQANFTTASLYFDHFFEDYNSGVGVILNADREGLAGLQSIDLGLQYAYQLRITRELTFRPGVEVAFYNRDINFDRLVFGDQLDESGLISDVTAEQFNTGTSKFFVDLTLGGLIFSENFYFGYAAHHVNTPNQSLVGEESRLQMKSTFHGGYRFLLPAGFRKYGFNDKGLERSLTPAFQYKRQGNFDQLDLGMYLTYEPVVFGLWYRGLPVSQLEDFPNNESIIALVGLMVGDLNIGYSFDYTVSGLGIQSGGAHEISLVYHFSLRDPSKPPRSIMSLPCPRF